MCLNMEHKCYTLTPELSLGQPFCLFHTPQASYFVIDFFFTLIDILT